MKQWFHKTIRLLHSKENNRVNGQKNGRNIYNCHRENQQPKYLKYSNKTKKKKLFQKMKGEWSMDTKLNIKNKKFCCAITHQGEE